MSSTDHASGAWLPAGKVAHAATTTIAHAQSERERKIAEEAEQLLASRWHIFIRTKERALEECRIHRAVRLHWLYGQRIAERIAHLAQALEPDDLMFVSSSDFETIGWAYPKPTAQDPNPSPAAPAMRAA